jgi:hypothetical protein
MMKVTPAFDCALIDGNDDSSHDCSRSSMAWHWQNWWRIVRWR